MQAAMGDADTVVNLIGKHYETKHLCFQRQEDGSISRVNSTFKNVSFSLVISAKCLLSLNKRNKESKHASTVLNLL